MFYLPTLRHDQVSQKAADEWRKAKTTIFLHHETPETAPYRVGRMAGGEGQRPMSVASCHPPRGEDR